MSDQNEKRLYTKIRYADSNVELEWQQQQGHDFVTASLASPDEPSPEFKAALEGYKPHVLRILELDREYGKGMEVRSVIISRKKDRRGVVINVSKTLAATNGPVNIPVPYMAEPGETGSGAGTMTPEMIALLDSLEAAADLYVEGRRSQVEMFNQNEGRSEPRTKKQQQDDIQVEEESRDALAQILDRVFKETGSVVPAKDKDLVALLIDVFGDVEYVDNHAGGKERKWPGAIKVKRGRKAIWCMVDAEGGVPRFWHDVNLEKFDRAGLAATFMGPRLLSTVRAMYPGPKAASPDKELSNAVRSHYHDTREAVIATPGNLPEILRQALHSALYRIHPGNPNVLPDVWQRFAESGVTDGKLESEVRHHFRVALGGRFQFTEQVGAESDSNVQFYEIRGGADPLELWIEKLNKRVVSLSGADMLAAVREVLQLEVAREPVDQGDLAHAGA